MKSLEESIVTAMDGTDKEIFPYLPYILQDFWEIGSSPTEMIFLIEKYKTDYTKLQVLDLGCGKGAVSIKIAEKLKCQCRGIDGIREFIEEAKKKALEYKVDKFCIFEQADIRESIKNLPRFDVIILGAIGQVFGDYYETLTQIKPCLNKNGIILIDDSYIEDSSTFTHPALFKKKELLNQISRAGMELIDELFTCGQNEIMEEHIEELDFIKLRCNELIKRHPEKQLLFQNYIKSQQEEYNNLDTKIISLTMVIKDK